MDPFLESTCAQYVWVAPYAGAATGGRGSATYGAITRYAARLEIESIVVELEGGERVSSSHRIITPAQITPLDRVWITDPNVNGKPRRLLRVRALPDEWGVFDHSEVLV